mmetsp:Transcript_54162/g.128649  ORF Transcript_54162/g.128649 Transcript_54162/m.128649 type:complete len:827 (-) Transcript_54162:233-2713(-)
MSIFKAREWWSTKVDGGEELDGACMAVGNIDNEADGSDKIVLGGFSGTVRIYKPTARGFKPNNIKCEQHLGAPILQVGIGVYSSSSAKDMQLAVLNPRRLLVFSVAACSTQDADGSTDTYYQLSILYKHTLTRSAYNFTQGSFGNAQGRDYIAVQSLDGELTIIEQEQIVFSKFLPNFLVPGPLCYIPYPTDSFVTVNSQFICEAFRFSLLASSSSGGLAQADDKDKEAKRAKADWALNLGESATSICVARHSSELKEKISEVIVLGERSIFWIKDNGQLRTTKRLDYSPLCMKAYHVKSPTQPGACQYLMVGATSGQIMIYGHDLQLVWGACLDITPVGLCVGTMGKVKGLVTSVSDVGEVCVSYMGTDPPAAVVNTAEKKQLNYEGMDEEHRQLLSVIRESGAARKGEPTDQLILRAQVPNQLDGGHTDRGWEAIQVTVKLFVSYTGTDALEDVILMVSAPEQFQCSVNTTTLHSVTAGGTPRTVPLVFTVANPALPTDIRVTISASYQSRAGDPRVAFADISLPLCLCGKAVPPIKNGAYKMTVDTNRDPVSLPALFEDLVPAESSNALPNVLSFLYHSGVDATIIVSKNAGRYRVQSGSLEALWLVTQQLSDRLSTHLSAASSPSDEPFEIGYSEELEEPMRFYGSVIDLHFEARLALKAIHEELEKSASQFRSIQKRLLVRFKDRNPAPLNELDSLLNLSYTRITEGAARGEAAEALLKTASDKLQLTTRLILLILRLRFRLDTETFEVLERHWSPVVEDTPDQGWEESTELSLSVLLKTSLGKGGAKEAAAMPQGPTAMLKDTVKLKRLMANVCERLAAR